MVGIYSYFVYCMTQIRQISVPDNNFGFLQKVNLVQSLLCCLYLESNPLEPGVFTMRLKFPDGYTISPHTHPNVEHVTVLSGNFLLGKGENMDKANTERLEAGSYTSMPPEMIHFVFIEGETVVQLTSVGPWEINYVNLEQDDPRLR